MAEKWMQSAVPKSHRGAFKAKAERAGMSTAEYARKVASDPHASTKTRRQAALARTFARYRGGKRKSRSSSRKGR